MSSDRKVRLGVADTLIESQDLAHGTRLFICPNRCGPRHAQAPEVQPQDPSGRIPDRDRDLPLFTLFNDYLQRNAIRDNLNSYLDEMGDVTAHNIQNWLSGRILLVESAAQSIGSDDAESRVAELLEQKALASTFMFSYLGGQDGSFLMRPAEEMPADYDPRARPWYKDAIAAGGSTLTEPYVDAASGELVISIATPAQQNGRNIGVVGGDLGLKVLVDIINALDFNGMGHAFLVSGDGKILVHPDGSKVMKSLASCSPGTRHRWTPTTARSNWTGRRASSASVACRACLR